jgi:hypothetical protein
MRMGMITLLVDGKQVPLRSVGTNDGLGYGRFHVPGLEIHDYELFVGRDELVARMSEEFDALVAEMKEDDRLDDEPSALQRMGYPTLPDAFQHPEDFEKVIRTFLDRDILVAFLPFTEESDLVVNSTDQIRVTREGVTLSGRCFRRTWPRASVT